MPKGPQGQKRAATEESLIWQEVADAMAEANNCDVLLLNGLISRPLDIQLIDLCASRRRRANILFVLVTEGGDADPSYRIARCLQESYDNFTFFASGYCKSAGTLIALGANELVIGDCGELGPLDIQMSKEDELGATRSGLTVLSALSTLHTAAYDAFEHFLLETKRRSRGSITTRTATHVATTLAGTLFAPIYEHVDAMHVGEAGRSLKIAYKYGELLQVRSQNYSRRTLNELTNSYPSHGFIIDRLQAENLFKNVRPPTPNEVALVTLLGNAALDPIPFPNKPLLAFLNSEPEEKSQELPSNQRSDDEPETTTPSADVEASEQSGDPGTDAARTGPDSPARFREVG